MSQAIFELKAELNDLLPPSKGQTPFTYSFQDSPAIKDTIESFGVPHPEVNIIVVNGKSVDFSYLLQDQDCATIYPASILPNLDILIPLQPPLPIPPSLVLDVHLGKLASFLRLLGLDTLYRNDYEDSQLANISAAQQRLLLTRDKGVLMRKKVTYGYYVRSTDPETQVIEVLQRFSLFSFIKPYTRCMRCNGILETVSKEVIIDQLPLKTRQEIHEFQHCLSCGQIYWRGAHYPRIQQFIDRVLSKE